MFNRSVFDIPKPPPMVPDDCDIVFVGDMFSSDHLDTGYGLACDVRRVVLYEGLKRDPRTGQSVATSDMARQYMNPGQILERTITLEGHIELDKFSVEMMALEDVVILRDLCNNHLNSMVKKVSVHS